MSGLLEVLDRLAGVEILVVGDAMVDVYHFGTVGRICPEAPVPVFVEASSEERAGGAANVANQLEALGVVPLCSFPKLACRKHRYLVGHQMLLRVDHEAHQEPSDHDLRGLRESGFFGRAKAVVLSDYAKGWLTPELCQAVIVESAACGIPVIVDPKGTSWAKYAGASLVVPNAVEFAAWDLKDWSPPSMVIKRGAEGMDVYRDHRSIAPIRIPSRARQVFDVTGAGDTVTAVLAASLAVGVDLVRSAELASIAAEWVVGQVGTAVIPLATLREVVSREDGPVAVPICQPAC